MTMTEKRSAFGPVFLFERLRIYIEQIVNTSVFMRQIETEKPDLLHACTGNYAIL